MLLFYYKKKRGDAYMLFSIYFGTLAVIFDFISNTAIDPTMKNGTKRNNENSGTGAGPNHAPLPWRLFALT